MAQYKDIAKRPPNNAWNRWPAILHPVLEGQVPIQKDKWKDGRLPEMTHITLTILLEDISEWDFRPERFEAEQGWDFGCQVFTEFRSERIDLFTRRGARKVLLSTVQTVRI